MKITTGELPSAVGTRLGRPGYSDSIMIISPEIVISAWAMLPSDPGRRPSSTASNAVLQNSISATTSRQNSRGITFEELSGTGLTLLVMACSPRRAGFAHHIATILRALPLSRRTWSDVLLPHHRHRPCFRETI